MAKFKVQLMLDLEKSVDVEDSVVSEALENLATADGDSDGAKEYLEKLEQEVTAQLRQAGWEVTENQGFEVSLD